MDEPDRSSMPPPEADDQPPPSGLFNIELFNASDILTPTDLKALDSDTISILNQLPCTGSVRIRIVDDEEMIRAHKQFCGLSTSTDVLTFDLRNNPSSQTPDEHRSLDTDLFVCAQQAQRQAESRGHTLIAELRLYILHGVLHCLGYDDHDPEQYQTMHTREDQVLTKAGFDAVFFTDPIIPEQGGQS